MSARQFVLLFCLILLLSACGQKGPLYLPEEPAVEGSDDDEAEG